MESRVKIMVTRRIFSGFKYVAEEVCRENRNVNVMPDTLFPAVVQFTRHLQDIRQSRVAKNS
jgi:hypothetical protein